MWCWIFLMGGRGTPSGSSSWPTLLNSSNMGFILLGTSRGNYFLFDCQSKLLLCLFWLHQEFASVTYRNKLWLLFLYWPWNKWNKPHGDLLALPGEHLDVSSASMGSIDIVLPWSPQKYVTHIHILIRIANWNRNMTKIRYLDGGFLLDPPNNVRVRVRFCLQF